MKFGGIEMKNKILAMCIISMFLLTSTSIVTATTRTPLINSDNNEGNGIRIVVSIYPLLTFGHRSLTAQIQSKNISHYLDGNFTVLLTYKETELLFNRTKGGFYSYYAYGGIASNISFSRPVIGTLFLEFTGSGKDYGCMNQ